jgi:hypothetical protein
VRRAAEANPDQAVRLAVLTAWVLGIVGLLGAAASEKMLAALLPAGLLLVVCGVVCFRNWRGVRDRLTERYKDSWHWRLSGKAQFTRFESALLTAIGLGWTAMGISGVVTLLA